MDFNEKIDYWKQLFKTKREEADQFYFNSMFEDVSIEFLPRSKDLENTGS